MLLFSHLEGCTLSLVRCYSLQYPGCYSRGCRSGPGFGCFCRTRIFQLRLYWNCGEHSDVVVERTLISFSFEIFMTNSDSLFDLMVADLLPISLMKLFSIAHGLNVIFFSGSILHLKCVGYDWGFDLGDTSPAKILWDLRLPTLLSACTFLIALFFFFNFTAVTFCHVSFSAVYALRFICALICFVTCGVFFSTVWANCFSSTSCFCVSVFASFMGYHGPRRSRYLYNAVSVGCLGI